MSYIICVNPMNWSWQISLQNRLIIDNLTENLTAAVRQVFRLRVYAASTYRRAEPWCRNFIIRQKIA
jgi:hypothetical protein